MRKGFTLIELMIVVAIIGIIAVIAIPSLLQSKLRANETSAMASCATYVASQTIWQNANYGSDGAYTDDFTELYSHTVDSQPVALIKQPFSAATASSAPYNGYYFIDRLGNSDWTSMNGLGAIPSTYAKSGTNNYLITENGTVYMKDTSGAAQVAADFDGPVAAGWTAK